MDIQEIEWWRAMASSGQKRDKLQDFLYMVTNSGSIKYRDFCLQTLETIGFLRRTLLQGVSYTLLMHLRCFFISDCKFLVSLLQQLLL
jgi:hypothetical protein